VFLGQLRYTVKVLNLGYVFGFITVVYGQVDTVEITIIDQSAIPYVPCSFHLRQLHCALPKGFLEDLHKFKLLSCESPPGRWITQRLI
jgi:hypothetical protein